MFAAFCCPTELLRTYSTAFAEAKTKRREDGAKPGEDASLPSLVKEIRCSEGWPEPEPDCVGIRSWLSPCMRGCCNCRPFETVVGVPAASASHSTKSAQCNECMALRTGLLYGALACPSRAPLQSGAAPLSSVNHRRPSSVCALIKQPWLLRSPRSSRRASAMALVGGAVGAADAASSRPVRITALLLRGTHGCFSTAPD